MVQRFNTELSRQQEWSWLLAIWLFMGGSGSGLFLLYLFLDLPHAFGLLALATVLLGGTVLLIELGNPLRVWRTVYRPGTSWLSRGVLFVSLFLISGILSVAPAINEASWLPASGGGAATGLKWIAGLCALMITLYPGFFLSANRAIPFWNTPLLPVLFFGFALLGGSGLVLLFSGLLETGLSAIMTLAAILIVVNLILVLVYLLAMGRSNAPARESVRLLNGLSLGWAFWIGVIAVGMVLPLIVALSLQSAAPAAGAAILFGGLLFRYCVLKAGVFVPPALVAGGQDFSKLNRNSDDLEREYAGMAADSTGSSTGSRG
ncbi:MAG: dimethyl sulfoxide reductase anchor subunit [Planctomycetota bacterium]|jgi:formate-dependent nitrite reductase membrane component NrfD|nr:dimethyl sulfoxide reductase anchor subunit [Planctomycetota bacterium]|tara:strand:- start:106 stop:1062 length:957 start_codon:yes stop_codon:yes gene_type:complete